MFRGCPWCAQAVHEAYLDKKENSNEADILGEIQLPPFMILEYMTTKYGPVIDSIRILRDRRVRNVWIVRDLVFCLKPFDALPGETVQGAGDMVTEIVFVTKGSVNLCRRNTRGQEVLLGRVTAGNIFADMEVLLRLPSICDYVAVGPSPCDLYAVEADKFRNTLSAYPEEAAEITAEAKERYRALKRVMQMKLFDQADVDSAESEVGGGGGAVAGRRQSGFWDDGLYKESTSLEFIKSNRGSAVLLRKSDLLQCRSRYLLHPDSTVLVYWEVFTLLLSIYSVTWSIFVVGFDILIGTAPVAIDTVIAVCFSLDVLVNFRTAFYDAEGSRGLVIDAKEIAVRYVRSWFLVDLLCSVPVFLIWKSSRVLRRYNAPVALTLVRGLRLVNIGEISRVVKSIEDYSSPAVINIVRLVVYMLLAAHTVCCFWWACADNETVSWRTIMQIQDAPVSRKYVAALYWTVTTLTTVGYGDIVPATSAERVIACVVMILGGMAFGYIIGNMSALVSRINIREAALEEKAESVSVVRVIDEWFHEFIALVHSTPTYLTCHVLRCGSS